MLLMTLKVLTKYIYISMSESVTTLQQMWSSGTAAVQAIWCHDITVAWVRIPAREEPKICESKFTDLTLLG